MKYDYLFQELSNENSSTYSPLTNKEKEKHIQELSNKLEKDLIKNNLLERKSIKYASKENC